MKLAKREFQFDHAARAKDGGYPLLKGFTKQQREHPQLSADEPAQHGVAQEMPARD
jgi:hypothetical protein